MDSWHYFVPDVASAEFFADSADSETEMEGTQHKGLLHLRPTRCRKKRCSPRAVKSPETVTLCFAPLRSRRVQATWVERWSSLR